MSLAPRVFVATAVLLACDAPASAPAPAAVASSPPIRTPSGAKALTPEAIDATRDAARKIAGSILVGGRTMATLVELTDTAGPRLTGSEIHKQAAAWAVARFQSYGVDATTDTFSLPRTWNRGVATARVLSPRETPLHVAAVGWTPGTPTEGVSGEVVKMDDVRPEAISRRKEELRGKIVYFDRAAAHKARGTHYISRLADVGAVASLVSFAHPGDVLAAFGCSGPHETASAWSKERRIVSPSPWSAWARRRSNENDTSPQENGSALCSFVGSTSERGRTAEKPWRMHAAFARSFDVAEDESLAIFRHLAMASRKSVTAD